MKKRFLIMAALAAVLPAMTSCSKNSSGNHRGEPLQAVDLGLKVKWASQNLGAGNPVEYGYYFQWAGTQNVADTAIWLDWKNCPYHKGSDSTTGWYGYIPSDMSSYCSSPDVPDNKTVLDPEDDAAHVILGGQWRIPTDDDWKELADNCTWKWMRDYNGTGISGCLVTSKVEGFTDKSIFLPAAGYRDGEALYEDSASLDDEDDFIYYWSSSLFVKRPYFAIDASYYGGQLHTSGGSPRYFGYPIRPVMK